MYKKCALSHLLVFRAVPALRGRPGNILRRVFNIARLAVQAVRGMDEKRAV